MNYIGIITFTIVIFAVVIAITASKLPTFRHLFRVPEGWAGLLYRDGLYVRRHNAGRKVVWGFGWTMNLVDLRKTSMVVDGQEVLTADKVGLKFSLLVIYEVGNPVVATHETQHWPNDLCHAAQLAARSVVAGVAAEELLHQLAAMSAQLLTRTQPEASRIGIHVLAVEVKEVIFPEELKRAFADVLKVKSEHPIV